MGSPCPGGLCLGLSVWGFQSRGSLFRGDLCPRGVSVQGLSVQGGGSLSRWVSVQGDICLEVPIQGGSLSRGSPWQRPHRQRPPRRNMGPVNQTGNDIIQRPLTRGQAPVKTLLCPITTTVCSRSVADPRGAPGMRAPPRGSKFFQFHAVFGKIWQNRMLAPPWGVDAPFSGKSWIRHCRYLRMF